MKLECRTPFDWNGLVTWLGARAIRGVESVDDGVYVRGDVQASFDARTCMRRVTRRSGPISSFQLPH